MEKDWDRREDSSCQSFVIKEKRSKKAAEKEGRIALVGAVCFNTEEILACVHSDANDFRRKGMC